MIQLIKMFWDICILKVGPQDVPASPFLLGITTALYMMTSLLASAIQVPLHQAMLATLIDVVLLTVLTRVLLWARMLNGRFIQTLTAMTGSGALMILIALPLVLLQQQMMADKDSTFMLPSWLLLAWMVWSVMVMGHILRHALSTLFFLGVGMAAIYAYISYRIMRILFAS